MSPFSVIPADKRSLVGHGWPLSSWLKICNLFLLLFNLFLQLVWFRTCICHPKGILGLGYFTTSKVLTLLYFLTLLSQSSWFLVSGLAMACLNVLFMSLYRSVDGSSSVSAYLWAASSIRPARTLRCSPGCWVILRISFMRVVEYFRG